MKPLPREKGDKRVDGRGGGGGGGMKRSHKARHTEREEGLKGRKAGMTPHINSVVLILRALPSR